MHAYLSQWYLCTNAYPHYLLILIRISKAYIHSISRQSCFLFQRVRKDILNRIRSVPQIRSAAENNFQLRVRKAGSAERNFQLRVRRSGNEENQPDMGKFNIRHRILKTECLTLNIYFDNHSFWTNAFSNFVKSMNNVTHWFLKLTRYLIYNTF